MPKYYDIIYNLYSSLIKWLKSHAEDEFIVKTKRFHKVGIVSIIILNLIIIIVSIIVLVIIIDIFKVYSSKAIDGLDYSNCYLASSFDNLIARNDENFNGYSII